MAMLKFTQSQKFTMLCFDLPRCYGTAVTEAIRHQKHSSNIFRKCGLVPLELLHRASASTSWGYSVSLPPDSEDTQLIGCWWLANGLGDVCKQGSKTALQTVRTRLLLNEDKQRPCLIVWQLHNQLTTTLCVRDGAVLPSHENERQYPLQLYSNRWSWLDSGHQDLSC